MSVKEDLSLIILAAGTVLGIALAAGGLIGLSGGRGSSLPDGAVARVNGQTITLEDYRRVLQGLASDTRSTPENEQRSRVLDRLIDEELLVQRALELGLAHTDRKVRADLIGSVISSIVAESEEGKPEEKELNKFYEENKAFFTQPGHLRVRQVFCRITKPEENPGASERAKKAGERLKSGDPFDTVRKELGDPELPPLPDSLLPPRKLVDYLGPTVVQAALSLKAGDVSEPIRSGAGFHVIQVIERQANGVPAFLEIRDQVEAEYRRRQGDRALRKYLDDLASRARIEKSPVLP